MKDLKRKKNFIRMRNEREMRNETLSEKVKIAKKEKLKGSFISNVYCFPNFPLKSQSLKILPVIAL